MSPKPAVSAWIAAERKRLGWKSEELARRLRDAGYDAAETTIRTWEAGRRPSKANLEALERLFDSRAPAEPTPGGDDLAGAIRMLVRELQAMREEREAIEARLRALEAVSLHVQSKGGGSLERSVLRATTE